VRYNTVQYITLSEICDYSIPAENCAGKICAINARELIVSEDFRERCGEEMYVAFVGHKMAHIC
jgi:hypothetical protein